MGVYVPHPKLLTGHVQPLPRFQVELTERKTFLSESKKVLLWASDALDGPQTRDKLHHDDRAVG